MHLKPIPCKLFFVIVLLTAIFMPILIAAETIDLRIQGLSGAELKNVEAALEFPSGILREKKVNWRWLDHYQSQIPEQVAGALEPFGYFHSITNVELTQNSPDKYQLIVRVETGEPVVLRNVSVTVEGPANRHAEIIRTLKAFPLKKGDVLRQDRYTKGKSAIRVAAVNNGFLKAEFTRHQIRVYPENNEAEIDLHLLSGAQYFFGEITISGAEEYPPKFLRRYLAFKPGDIYQSSRWNQTRANFQGANRFEDIILIRKIDSADDQRVPVEINLGIMPTIRLRNGIGYGDKTGVRLSSDYVDVNVFALGHEFNTELILGQYYQLAELRYTIPGSTHVDNADVFSLSFEREDNSSYKNYSGAVAWEKFFSLGSGKVASFYTRYFHEVFEVGEEDSTSRLLMPGFRYVQRSFNDPGDSRKGYQYRLELRGANKSLFSDVSLVQGLAAGTTFWPLIEKFSLFLRLEGAYTIKQNDFEDIPPSLRFFVGGDNSVRGYGYKTQGPRDLNGDVVGGEAFLAGSLELERKMGQNWGLAAFYDIGSAFNPGDAMKFIQGAGVGLRIYTPVGPIKMDLARQLAEEDPSFRFHLSIGFNL